MRPTFVSDLNDKLLTRLRELYRELHQHPELSLAEHKTTERTEAEVSSLDVEVQRIGGTGVVAIIRNGSGPTVLARADIDALRTAEETGLEYASKVDGVMHSCGHDMHIVTLLGALEVLANNTDAWSGTYIGGSNRLREPHRGLRQCLTTDSLTRFRPRMLYCHST